MASAGCSTTIGGQEPEPQSVDGGVQTSSADAAPQPDAEPQPDAAPQVAPCVEGDAQLSGSDDTCYMYFSAPLDFTAAQAACLGVGATLVTVLSADEQVYVAELAGNAPASGIPDVWLGATDELVENSFVWVDGTPMNFDHWRTGEPNNGNGGAIENCTIIEGDNPAREWDDRPCTSVFPYLCERAP